MCSGLTLGHLSRLCFSCAIFLPSESDGSPRYLRHFPQVTSAKGGSPFIWAPRMAVPRFISVLRSAS